MFVSEKWSREFSCSDKNCKRKLVKFSNMFISSLNQGGKATLMYEVCALLEKIQDKEIKLGTKYNKTTSQTEYIAKSNSSWIKWDGQLLESNEDLERYSGFWILPFVAYLIKTNTEFKGYIDEILNISNANMNFYKICDFLYFSRINYLPLTDRFDDLVVNSNIEPKIDDYVIGDAPKTKATAKPRKKKKINTDLSSFKLDYQISDERKKYIPSYNLNEMIVTEKVLYLANLVKKEQDSLFPVNNILLYGDPGTGKTTNARILAQLWGLPYKNFNFSFGFEESDIIGSYKPHPDGTFKFQETDFIETYKDGGVFELTELDYAISEKLGFFNTPLDKELNVLRLGDGTEIKRHPQCILIATMNVDDVACQKTTIALRDRFSRKVKIEKPDRESLIKIIEKNSGYKDKKIIDILLDVGEEISSLLEEPAYSGEYRCTVRSLIDWAHDIKHTGDPVESSYDTIVSGVSFDPVIQNEIIDIIQQHF